MSGSHPPGCSASPNSFYQSVITKSYFSTIWGQFRACRQNSHSNFDIAWKFVLDETALSVGGSTATVNGVTVSATVWFRLTLLLVVIVFDFFNPQAHIKSSTTKLRREITQSATRYNYQHQKEIVQLRSQFQQFHWYRFIGGSGELWFFFFQYLLFFSLFLSQMSVSYKSIS